MSLAAAEREMFANGMTVSQYRDGFHPVRIELRPSNLFFRPAESVFGPIPTNPGRTIATTIISVFVNILKR